MDTEMDTEPMPMTYEEFLNTLTPPLFKLSNMEILLKLAFMSGKRAGFKEGFDMAQQAWPKETLDKLREIYKI